MRFYVVIVLCFLTVFYSCNNSSEKEVIEDKKPADTTKSVTQYVKTDYPKRVYAFKKMPDSTVEDQVKKYEQFSALFIEFVGINKIQPLYSPQDQESNTQAYNVLRDEMVSLKEKLRKNMAVISKTQEIRLDSADAKMNKFLPQVYK